MAEGETMKQALAERWRWWCRLRRHWRTDGFFTGGRERFTIDGKCGYCGAEV